MKNNLRGRIIAAVLASSMAVCPIAGTSVSAEEIQGSSAVSSDTANWWDTAAGEKQNSGGGILYETPSEENTNGSGAIVYNDEENDTVQDAESYDGSLNDGSSNETSSASDSMESGNSNVENASSTASSSQSDAGNSSESSREEKSGENSSDSSSSSAKTAQSISSSSDEEEDLPSDPLSKEALDRIDFSSGRILVGTDNKSVIRKDDLVLSSYDDVYLLDFVTASKAESAYRYYYNKVDFIDADAPAMKATSDTEESVASSSSDDSSVIPNEEKKDTTVTDVTDSSQITEDANPVSALSEALDENSKKVKHGTIALIDSGVSDDTEVQEQVSMLGDDGIDGYGHGTRMARLIRKQDPDARILSIKALDANGNGTVASVYSAIRYAIDRKVDVISLSLSGSRTAAKSSIENAIQEACDAGITVIGAAGNDGKNAKYTIPGNSKDAIIAGACDQEKMKRAKSNYGESVDYYVYAPNTSEAVAYLTGTYSLEGKIEADNQNIFLPEKISKAVTMYGHTLCEEVNAPEKPEIVSSVEDTSEITDESADFSAASDLYPHHQIPDFSKVGWFNGQPNTLFINAESSQMLEYASLAGGAGHSSIFTAGNRWTNMYAGGAAAAGGNWEYAYCVEKDVWFHYGEVSVEDAQSYYSADVLKKMGLAQDYILANSHDHTTQYATIQSCIWYYCGSGLDCLPGTQALAQKAIAYAEANYTSVKLKRAYRIGNNGHQHLIIIEIEEGDTPYDPGFLHVHKTTQFGAGINGIKFYVKYTPDPENRNRTAHGKRGTKYANWTPDKREAAGDYDEKTWEFTTKWNPTKREDGWIDWRNVSDRWTTYTADYYKTNGDPLNYFQSQFDSSPVPVFWPGTYEVWEDEASAAALNLQADTKHYVGHVILSKDGKDAHFQWDKPGYGQSLELTTGGNFVNYKVYPGKAKSQAYVDSTKTQVGASVLPDGSQEIVIKDILYLDGFMEYESDVTDSILKLDGKLIDVSDTSGGSSENKAGAIIDIGSPSSGTSTDVIQDGKVLATGKFAASGSTSLQLSPATVKNYKVISTQNRKYTHCWTTYHTGTYADGSTYSYSVDHKEVRNATNPTYKYIQGEVLVEYKFTISDPKQIEGHTLVVSTGLDGKKQAQDDVDLGEHWFGGSGGTYDEPGVGCTGLHLDLKDAKDANETVNFPKIRTIAFDNNSTDHTGTVGDKIQITDVVRYTNLRLQGDSPSEIKGSGTDYWKVKDKGKNEWKIKAYLMYRDSSSAPNSGGWKSYADEKGPVTAEKEFTPSSADGTESITFRLDQDTFNALKLSNKDTTCWEELYVKNPATGEWVLVAEHVPGKNTGYNNPDDENEQLHFPEIHTTLYQNDVSNGDTKVSQDASVSGNTMTYNNPGTTGINDRATQLSQRVQERKQYDSTNPNESKKPTYDDHADGQAASPDTFITYVDRVAYSNLIPGHTYVMESTLWGKETLRDADTSTEEASNPARPVRGEYLNGYTDANGTYHEGSSTKGIVTGRTIFTPTTANMPNGMASGTVDVKIVFNSNYAPGTLVVAFEDLKVRTLNDSGKAVYTGFVEAGASEQFHGSNLTDAQGNKNGDVKKTGWGNNGTDDSTEYVESGFRNDTTDSGNRRPSGEAIVATHSDINDKGQSIMVEFVNHLGNHLHAGGRGTAMFYIAAAILAGAAVLLIVRKKRKEKGLPENVR